MLEFDYELVRGKKLAGALGGGPLTYNDGSLAFDDIIFTFDDLALLFIVDDNTDEIVCRISENLIGVAPREVERVPIKALQRHIGCEMGWLWFANNYLGYADMVTISFSGMDPDITLVGIASKLNLYSISKI